MSGSGNVTHEGFAARVAQFNFNIIFSVGENISVNNSPDPSKTAIDGWATTPRNVETMLADYTISGVGVKRGTGDYPKWYITQILANAI
jgi:uncharacterized protein YkwD